MDHSQTVPPESRDSASSLSIMNRRAFLERLGLLGGGLMIYLVLGGAEAEARAPREGFQAGRVPTDFNAFLRIGADNRVTCFVGKIEMGQGPITSLAQMMAEELDVPYESVYMVMGDTDRCPWDAGTWGSLSTRQYGVFVKEAACEAKGVLKELASARLSCPVERLVTEKGFIFDRDKPGNRVSYGQLTAGKIIEKHLKDLPPFKPVAEYTISGRPYLRRDALEKVTGQARYTGDMHLPGMVYARILRPPAHGAKLRTLDTSATEKIEGVKVVMDGDLLAVLHEHPDEAQKALEAVKAEFELPNTGLDDQTIFDHLLQAAPAPVVAGQAGDLEKGEGQASVIIEETYFNSYVAHAAMETHTALANFEGGQVTVWASTQTPFGTQDQIAQALGLPAEKVRVVAPFLGGGFGGKGSSTQALEAARLAQKAGRPVMVMWTREEEFFLDTFRPAAVVKVRSGLNQAGHVTFWDYKVYLAGERGSDNFYDIENHRETVYGEWYMGSGPHPFAVGAWRAPGANTNVYAKELTMNILAAKAGQDPVEFRLAHLKDQRMRDVLTAAAKKFGWTSAKTPSGRGFGVACGVDAETYVALMAEVEVDRETGRIKVKRVVCAQDMGQVINPEGAALQMEGCITMGLGYALTEEIHFKSGRISDLNFDTYEIPRFSWLPEIETVIVPNPELPPKGGGEPAIVCMGGVLATAVYDATGAVIRQLPMTPERVKKALEKQRDQAGQVGRSSATGR